MRFEVQDTNEKAQLLTNQEIAYAITREAPGKPPSETEVLRAAAHCCDVLVRRFSMQADTQLGSLSVTYSKQAATFAERARELRTRAQGSGKPWAGGLSKAEKVARAEDDDRVQPSFRRGQFDVPQGQLPSQGEEGR